MAGETFEKMRAKALREHKHSIVGSAKNGHKAKGRGLVLVRLTGTGTVHRSYLTLEALEHQHIHSGPEGKENGRRLVEKFNTYSPDSEVLVMVTNGQSERFSIGVKRSPDPL